MSRIYLGPPGCSLGVAVPGSKLEELEADPELWQLLSATGVLNYLRSDASPVQLADEAIRGALERSQLAAEDVDEVVLATTSFYERRWLTDDIFAAFSAIGLSRVTPIGVTLSECGNLAPALRVASALIQSEAKQNVIVACSDVVRAERSRLNDPPSAILSDGAAAIVLSSQPREGWLELLGVAQVAHHASRDLRGGSELLPRLLRNVRDATRACLARLPGYDPDRLAVALLPNLGSSALSALAAAARVPRERVFTSNVGRLGHVFASDALIALAEPEVLEALQASDKRPQALVLQAGIGNVGAALLEVHHA
jgi:3-oxoacyl-[acyl-carrier-protein] synthase-3